MAAHDDEFFASLERVFTGIGCTMEAQTTVSNSTPCGLFLGEYKKYTVSGVTSFFKIILFSGSLPVSSAEPSTGYRPHGEHMMEQADKLADRLKSLRRGQVT